MSASKQIRVGALLSYLSIALNIVVGLLYTPWMEEQIGQSDFGLYTLANSLITMFLVDFGLSSAVSRYVAKYRAEGRQDKIDNFLGAVYRLYTAITVVILLALVVVYFLLDIIYAKLTPTELQRFKVIYLISAAFAVISFPCVTFNGILNAYEKFIQLKLADAVGRVLLVGITVVALLMGYGLYALVTIHATVALLLNVYRFIVIRKMLPVRVNLRYHDRSLYKDVFGFSLWVTVATLAQRLIFNITPTVLGHVSSSAHIAVFGIVVTIEGYAYTFTSALNGMFMPKISRIYQEEDAEQRLMPLMLRVGRFQFALNGLIVAGFACVGYSFINLWMGPEYLDAYAGILLVLIPGLFFNSLEIANTALVVQKKVKLQAIVTLVTGLVSVSLSLILSSLLGVFGACLAICAAYTLRAIALNIIYYKLLNLDILLFIKQCYLRMGIPVLLTALAGLGINRLLADAGWGVLIAKGGIVVVIYLALTALIGLSRQERCDMIGKIKQKLSK